MDMNDVGVLVSGSGPTTIQNLNVGGKSTRPCAWDLVEDRALFEEKHGIKDTSMPERLVLLRLLEENISPKKLRRVWRDELYFDERETPCFCLNISAAVPWVFGALAGATITTQVLFSMPEVFSLTPATHVAVTAIWLCLIPTTAWVMWSDVFPYLTAKRLQRFVDKVNPELPALIAHWKKDRWYRQACNESTVLVSN